MTERIFATEKLKALGFSDSELKPLFDGFKRDIDYDWSERLESENLLERRNTRHSLESFYNQCLDRLNAKYVS